MPHIRRISSTSTTQSPPLVLPSDLKVSLKRVRATLDATTKELDQRHNPSLNIALTKVSKLLKLSKRAKNVEEAVRNLVVLADLLNATVLAPILEASQMKDMHVSYQLKNRLQVLANDIINAIPNQSRAAQFSSRFKGGDTDPIIVAANVKIESALSDFLQQGKIEMTQGFQLVQTDYRPEKDLPPPPHNRSLTSLTQPINRTVELDDTSGPSTSSDVTPSRYRDKPTTLRPAATRSWEANGTNMSRVSELFSNVDGVLDRVPRFRILLLGNSGVGKSSLINNVFKVPRVEVSHYQAGAASVYNEITSDSNPHFVMHDSLGFESGSTENYNVVDSFIKDRGRRTQIAEKLHAIWLCTTVPITGGRLFELGDEKIFEMDIGNVPLIVVFTKYDALVTKMDMELNGNSMDDGNEDDLIARARAAADRQFEDLCVRPLKGAFEKRPRQAGLPPFTKVSVNPGYEDTIAELIMVTRDRLVASNVTSETTGRPTKESPDQGESAVGLTWAIAQRANADISVEASIAIGRQRYWTGLASSLDYQGKALNDCLETILADIVRVWNFHDPEKLLLGREFKAMMLETIDDLGERRNSTTKASVTANLSTAGALAGLAASMATTSSIVIAPVAAAAALSKWMYDSYQQSPWVLQSLMGYIVDLTIIMRRLFWHMRMSGSARPLSKEVMRRAIEEFSESRDKVQVHRDIRAFIGKMDMTKLANKDYVVNEIVRLIRKYPFDPLMPKV